MMWRGRGWRDVAKKRLEIYIREEAPNIDQGSKCKVTTSVPDGDADLDGQSFC